MGNSWTNEQRERTYERWTPEARKAHGDKIRQAAKSRHRKVFPPLANTGPVLFTRKQLADLCADLEEKIRIGNAARNALAFFRQELIRLETGARCEPLTEDWEADPASEAGDVPLRAQYGGKD